MQQKESFLKTKKGKIVVGSVGSVIGALVLYLIIAYVMKWIPFREKITPEDAESLKTKIESLVADTEAKTTVADNDKIYDKVKKAIEAFESKVTAVNDKRATEKKIDTTEIANLKTAVEGLKNQDTQENFKAAAKNFKVKVANSITNLKTVITEKNK
ncbi:MAG: hypothetical protein ACN23H_00255 [Candidatus Phytoplasma vitis]|uniref:Imp n=1 Tax=Phytoplasma vitis TaxID=131152 RepID=A0A5J6CPI0_PHYVT|nr:Imp [Candidatus Phytoplasma vitis]USQ93352.1 MAG: hypothetical protein M6G77_02530 [Candidatus Phytoplasma vitis]